MPDDHDDIPEGAASSQKPLPRAIEDFLRRMTASTAPAQWSWKDLTGIEMSLEAKVENPTMNSWAVRDKTGKLWGHLLSDWQESLDEGFLPLLGELLRLETKLAATEERAARAEALALLDPLTGLPNRRAWERTLASEEQRCRRANHPAAILCLDLDRLKEKNDAAGHAAGDELLRRTADCLRQSIRVHDHAARLGGDEFAVLLVECAADCLPGIVARLRASLRAARIAATLGWAARPAAGDLQTTWQAADQALIAAKQKLAPGQ